MTGEIDEMSAGSRGSHADAWAVEHGGSIVHVAIRAYDAHEWAGGEPFGVVPLYRSPTLTDAEREAIEKAIGRELDAEWYGGPEPDRVVVLRGLLERLG